MSFLLKAYNLFKSENRDKVPAPAGRPGRNDPCWCGSGKKYKKCHLEEDWKKLTGKCAPSCGPT